MGCFVRSDTNSMECFVRVDKNYMGCFVRGGKSMRDFLAGVSKNGMGCFVPGCFVLHSDSVISQNHLSFNNFDYVNHFFTFLPYITEEVSQTTYKKKYFWANI